MLKLKDWALREGVQPHTAYRWFHAGVLPVPARRVGPRLIIVEEEPSTDERSLSSVAVYARVSSSDQKGDLEGQVERVTEWLTGQGCSVSVVVTEVGSGMNGNRTKLKRLLSDPDVGVIAVEHRDRFGRMNVELVEAALASTGRSLMVMDDREVEDDFVRDVTEVLTSLCARLYGRRGARNRARKALAAAGCEG